MAEVNFRKLASWISALILVLVLFFGVKTINEIKAFRYIGGDSFFENNSISISGEGEVLTTADIANFSYSVVKTGATIREAEEVATAKWNEILSYLEDEGIESRDVKTVYYAIDPQYAPYPIKENWVPLSEREIVGYTVTQSAQIKVRETDKTGELLSAVGGMGVHKLSGISFTIDDESELVARARALAIEDAQEKAKILARELGVSLGKVVGFYEYSGGYPYYPYAVDERAMMSEGVGAGDMVSPEIPMGESRVVVNVDIMYRIR